MLYVYSRAGCHLCEIMIEELLPLLRGRARIEVRDIDTNPQWLEKYDLRVPVLEFDGRCVCEARLDTAAVTALLATIH